MKLVNLKCPNCDGILTKKDDALHCESCGAVFAIDYDESDVEIERLRMEAAKEKDSNTTTDKSGKNSKASRLVILAILLFFVAIPFAFMGIVMFQNKMMAGFFSSVAEEEEEKKEVENYNVTADDVNGMLDEFIESGKIIQMNIEQCAYWDLKSSVKYYDKTDAEFESAYLVTDIPNENPKKTNRLVVIYRVTWNNENIGDKVCYDAVYFEGLRVNPNGGVISNFDGETIDRSDAAWGWSMAYSFEDLNQCYRENITALGGKAEKLTE